jgi:predicted DNA-binding antitoxin AbrB/MazE fold protein
MTGTVQAVYENGVLRLLQPLDLPEHERVIITIACDGEGTLSAAVPSTSEPFVSYEGFDPLLDELSMARTLPNLPIDFSGPIPEGYVVPEVEPG